MLVDLENNNLNFLEKGINTKMGSKKAKYDSSNYDAAKAKYDELAKKYEGASGINIGRAQGSNIAETAGKSAVQSATAGARSAGMNKAQSALAGMGAGSKAASDNYAQGVNQALTKQQNELTNAAGMVSKASEVDRAKYEGKIKQQTGRLGAVSSALGSVATVAAPVVAAALSDETLKNLYPDMGDDILDAFRKIRSCEFTYKPEAIDKAETEILPGVDTDKHMGVSAQDVEKVFPESVMDNGSGHKLVDTKEMTMANTAAIAELARKVKNIEERL